MTIHALFLAGLVGPADNEGLALVREALLRPEGQKELRDELVARRLSALGSRAAPALLTLVEGTGLELLLGDEETPVLLLCAPDRVGEVALAALVSLPVEGVLAALRAELARAPGAETRALAFRVLAALRSARALELTLELLREADLELGSPSVRNHARAALCEPLRHDARALATLTEALDTAGASLLPLLVEALGATQDEASLAPLEGLLGRTRELDLAVVETLALAGETRPWRMAAGVAEVLERSASAKDPARRAAATRALGRLARVESVPRLLQRLEDPAPEVVAAALEALGRCARRADLAQPGAWREFLAREKAWWDEQGEARVASLREAEASSIAAHLRELLAHPMAREEVADALLAHLDEREPHQLALTCSALARLGVQDVVPDLVPLLDSAEAPVREAVWHTLKTLTGVELPCERSLWDAWAFE